MLNWQGLGRHCYFVLVIFQLGLNIIWKAEDKIGRGDLVLLLGFGMGFDQLCLQLLLYAQQALFG